MEHPSVDVNVTDVIFTFQKAIRIVYITEWQLEIVKFINLIFLSGLVSVFGTVGNVINLVVFYRQGLNTTINISFFSLAVSDISCLLVQLWHIIISLFQYSDLPIMYSELQHATAAWPHETFSRVSCSITVYITVERCVCIAFPLTVKKLFTIKRATVIILCIYISTLVSWVPLYTACYIGWKFIPDRNITLLGLIFTNQVKQLEGVYFTNAFFGVLSVFIVVAVTLILIWQLKKRTEWRKSAIVDQKKSDSMSNRERTTVMMVVLIAIILIVCYTPSVILCVVTFYYPEFSVGGTHFLLYNVLWSTAYLLENVNASVNIFLYFKMSSKYRSTFNSIFRQQRIT